MRKLQKLVERLRSYITDGKRDESVPTFPFMGLDDIVASEAERRGVAGKNVNDMPEPDKKMLAYLGAINAYSGDVYGATARALHELRRDVGLFGFEKDRQVFGRGELYGDAYTMLQGDDVVTFDHAVDNAVDGRDVGEYLRCLALLNFALAEEYVKTGIKEAAGVVRTFNQLGEMLADYRTQRLLWEKKVGYVKPVTELARK